MKLAWPRFLGGFLILFGLLTIKEGGAVLFFEGQSRIAAGHYVPFVVWFNFLAGFLYLAAGTGVAQRRAWSARAAVLIAASTAVAFIALFIHIVGGGLYEKRTIIAMTLRTSIWTVAAIILLKSKSFLAKNPQ